MKLFSNSLFLATALILAFETQAAIRFLPDVDQRNSGIEDEDVKMSIDDSLCARSVVTEKNFIIKPTAVLTEWSLMNTARTAMNGSLSATLLKKKIMAILFRQNISIY